jgi:type 1 glutamine amidotransferase
MARSLARALLPLVVALCALPAGAQEKKLVLIAGKRSHGPGDHEFRAGMMLLQKCLGSVKGLKAVVETEGWVADPKVFDGAAAVALYSDGGGGNPFLQGDHKKVIGDLAKKGVGIAMMHYAVEVPKDNGGPEFLEWIGGHYEHQYSCNPMWAPDYKTFPKHPITRGVKPFSCRDEWYMHMRFRPDMKGVTPLLVDKPSDKVRKGPYVYPAGPYEHIVAGSGQDEVMMWCVERPDGGRGFGWTGGHYHKNWGDPGYRKVVLNALVWLCKMEVPASGIESEVTEEDLKQNLDKKK